MAVARVKKGRGHACPSLGAEHEGRSWRDGRWLRPTPVSESSSVVERGVTYTTICPETGCRRLSGTPELSGGESFLGRAPFDGLVSICSEGRWPRVIVQTGLTPPAVHHERGKPSG